MLKIDDVITARVDSLAFGGEGIVKYENFVIFVPFTAPNDLISFRISNLKKSFGFGELIEVLEKGKERIEPACPYFGTCGGCQMQHLSYSSQLSQKKQWIDDAFKRVGKLEIVAIQPVHPSPLQYHYRRHVSLTIQKNSKGIPYAGYTAINGKTILRIETCPIFERNEERILKELQSLIEKFEMEDQSARVTVLKNANGHCFLHFHFNNLPKNVTAFQNHPFFIGIVFGSRKKTLTFGIKEAQLFIEGLNFAYSSDVFMQNNSEQSLNIYKEIVRIAKESKPEEILDLYCGIGISSLLLAKEGIRVLGIESNHRSIRMAIYNAKENQLSNAKFIHAEVEKTLNEIKIPNFVIINPPREGMNKRVVEALKERLPEKIIYISCMPATLARDLQLLGKENYQIVECRPFDMFPQTTHVETLVSLQRI